MPCEEGQLFGERGVENDRKRARAAFEQRALEYLRRPRLRFVARNFACRGGEIERVMREIGSQRARVFVEVRARRSRQFAAAAASIGAHKQRRLVLAAQHDLMTRVVRYLCAASM
ncbi:YraN family protein [Caballeronia mineralivorans]|uniref:YraN family protein n=1 Tax=Caballeronia mineralivorans TaxID=2010198 RepID=UPI0038996C74